MTYNFNTEPYFDDFDELNNYLKILFRPGYAVQTRELTQIQSILQNQNNSISKHLFKSGTSIIDGRLSYQPRISYVKILNIDESTVIYLNLMLSEKTVVLTGQDSGVKAEIFHLENPDSTYNDYVIYIKYVSEGNTGETKFLPNEILISDSRTGNLSTSGHINLTVQSDIADNIVTGYGSLISISNGIYYVDGYFITVNEETIILDRYDINPNYIVGLQWTDEIVTSNEDSSLNDNATGSPNYAAPGAHRYKISGSLTKFNFTDTSDKPNFIKLWSAEEGITVSYEDKTDYNQIEDFIAKRTYEESGNYVAKDFNIILHEDRNNYRMDWVANSNYLNGDVIKELDIDGNKQFYICTTGGSSGSTKPLFPNTFSIVTDNQISWKFSKTAFINRGLKLANPSIEMASADFSDYGYDHNYILKISGGVGVVKGHTLRQSGELRLQNTKSRNFKNREAGVIQIDTPTYILVQDPSTFPDNTGLDFIDLSIYSEFSTVPGTPPAGQTKIGTCKARWIEKHTEGFDLYRLYTHDIIMDAGYSFTRNAKSLYTQNTGALDFTGNITQEYSELSGNISGTVGTPYINGAGTSFDTELSVGDYVTADNINYYKITNITVGTLTISINLITPIVTSTFRRVNSQITGNSNSEKSFYRLEKDFIKNLKSADGLTSDTAYNITRRLPNQTVGVGNTDLSFIISGNDTFSPITLQNYTIIETLNGMIVNNHTISRSSDAQTLTIGNLTPSTEYTVYATILRSETLATDKQILIGMIDVTTSVDVNAELILLGKADCIKLLEVKVANAFGTINAQNLATTDITNLFKIDTGQKTLYYDIGSIAKNRNEIVNGSIRIYFEYFDHVNAVSRDYFSVESYGSINYNFINHELRDSIDFRPVKNDNGIGFKNANFGIIKPDTDVSADYSYYVSRLDYLVLTSEKTLEILRGDEDKPPTVPNGSMVLYEIGNIPYGGIASDDVVLVKKAVNRYTMKDIETLNKRIGNLEYYSSLSLIESSVADIGVVDENGLTLFKNGFVVDNFKNSKLVDFNNIDHRMNASTLNGKLRPNINESIITLEENGSVPNRLNAGYVINSGVVTLPYSEVTHLSNYFASRTVNVNPFNVTSFKGIVDIYPSSDIWIDETTLPTIID